MSHRNVETLLGRLATDPGLRRRFREDREALLEEFRSRGYDLTAIELEALASTEPAAIDRFARSLDERLRKAEVITNPLRHPQRRPFMSSVSSLLEATKGLEVQGVCPDRFDGVRRVLAAKLASGADLGASVAVYIDGEPVVDIWGGYFDETRTRPWERDTIVNTFSTT